MATSIDALDLPIQLFALGTAVGMLSASIRHRRTGDTEHWPIHIANYALTFFGAGLLVSIGCALF